MTADLSPTAIRIKDVTKTFESGTEALASLNLEIKAGSFVTVIGPSGCGKSTLLRLIAGLSSVSSGSLSTTFRVPDQHARTGFVFQDATLMPWATLSANIALPLQLEDDQIDSGADKVDTALDWVGLSQFKNAYPRELSGGMRMRASIARALVTQPSLLLLDEPFAALDEFSRARLNEDLLRLWESQKWTGIFVTHNIREAVFLSDRVIVMSPRPGRVIADVDIPFAHPRTASLRDDHDFSDLCADISRHLADAISGESP